MGMEVGDLSLSGWASGGAMHLAGQTGERQSKGRSRGVASTGPATTTPR